MKNDPHNIHMSEVPREPKIPTPEELKDKIRGKVAAKNINPITEAIVKEMLEGNKYALVAKDTEGVEKHWDTIFPLLRDKFRDRGWTLSYSDFSQDAGPDYQSFKRHYFKISWEAYSQYSDF